MKPRSPSPVFREFMHQLHLHPGLDDLSSLTAIWQVIGRPSDNPPLDYRTEIERDQRIENRGAEGVWADHETAAWYSQTLDNQITPDAILELLYR